MNMDEGCLFQIIIYIVIAVAILYAILIAVAATAVCGSIYGTYKAAVCYATALKRTYGKDETYEAGKGMKTLAACVLVMLLFVTLGGTAFLVSAKIPDLFGNNYDSGYEQTGTYENYDDGSVSVYLMDEGGYSEPSDSTYDENYDESTDYMSEDNTLDDSEYLIPESDTRYLNSDDIKDLSKEEIRIAKNEIFARHGRKFKDSSLQAYFDSKPWYNGTISPEAFTEAYANSVFNDYEKKNADFLLKAEEGYSTNANNTKSSSASAHKYEYVLADITWDKAVEKAESKGGHLVTINSQEEFDKITKTAYDKGFRVFWAGAKISKSDNWNNVSWITGESFSFTRWLSGEPSGYNETGIAENKLLIFHVEDEWYYNDAENDDAVNNYKGKMGYIIEYED